MSSAFGMQFNVTPVLGDGGGGDLRGLAGHPGPGWVGRRGFGGGKDHLKRGVQGSQRILIMNEAGPFRGDELEWSSYSSGFALPLFLLRR
jgi:hypothetical protein